MHKRLIACCDGTWNKPAMKDRDGNTLNSNVCFLYDAIAVKDETGISQMKVYDTGVGSTYRFLDKIMGGLTGAGIDKKIQDAYLFFVLNYQPGDEIYLFGFSRGAYTARSLTGLIRCCGILKPENIQLITIAYQLYRDRNEYTAPDSDMMCAFRRSYCFENITRIKCIGVWDTVGALGIPLPAWRLYNQERYKFHDTKLSSTIDYAYQALAIDEHRKKFAPVLWEESRNTDHGKTIDMEQRWFAGAHGNIGGGNADMGLSNYALHWMVNKARYCGLFFDQEKLALHQPNIYGQIENSFTGIYRVSGWLQRTVKDSKFPNQVIDESVFQRIRHTPDYRPPNIVPKWFNPDFIG